MMIENNPYQLYYKQDPIWKICNIIPLSLDEIDIIEKKYNNISL